MTTQHAVSTHPARSTRLALARDLVVLGLCALVAVGFIFDLQRGASTAPPAAVSGEKLSS